MANEKAGEKLWACIKGRLKMPRGPRVTSINDAVHDMAINGEGGLGVSTIGEMPPPPATEHRVIGEQTPFDPHLLYGDAGMMSQQPVQSNKSQTYFLITCDKSEIIRIETLSEDDILKRIEELGGVANAVSMLPTQNPVHWGGRYVIIKGQIVVPKEVRSVKLV